MSAGEMLPDSVKSTVVEWSDLVWHDLNSAHVLFREREYRNAAFYAQQAAEKAAKVVLIFHQIPYPYTHFIGEIVEIIARVEPYLAELLTPAASLSQYAVTTRYRGKPISEAECRAALSVADDVSLAVKAYVEAHGVRWELWDG